MKIPMEKFIGIFFVFYVFNKNYENFKIFVLGRNYLKDFILSKKNIKNKKNLTNDFNPYVKIKNNS